MLRYTYAQCRMTALLQRNEMCNNCMQQACNLRSEDLPNNINVLNVYRVEELAMGGQVRWMYLQNALRHVLTTICIPHLHYASRLGCSSRQWHQLAALKVLDDNIVMEDGVRLTSRSCRHLSAGPSAPRMG